jgi:hypothetical protein
MQPPTTAPRPGHGDHWLAALDEADPRLRGALAVPIDAPEPLTLHRRGLTEALDMVQVTRGRSLITAYPEPRATALVEGRPRELALWENRAEAWLTLEHPDAGALTLFLTDLAEHAPRYAAAGARAALALEVGALAYRVDLSVTSAPSRLQPAARADARFLPDDYSFDADVVEAHDAGDEEVLDLAFHGGLSFPVATRHPTGAQAGDRVRGYLWLTGRVPEATGAPSKRL